MRFHRCSCAHLLKSTEQGETRNHFHMAAPRAFVIWRTAVTAVVAFTVTIELCYNSSVRKRSPASIPVLLSLAISRWDGSGSNLDLPSFYFVSKLRLGFV